MIVGDLVFLQSSSLHLFRGMSSLPVRALIEKCVVRCLPTSGLLLPLSQSLPIPGQGTTRPPVLPLQNTLQILLPPWLRSSFFHPLCRVCFSTAATAAFSWFFHKPGVLQNQNHLSVCNVNGVHVRGGCFLPDVRVLHQKWVKSSFSWPQAGRNPVTTVPRAHILAQMWTAHPGMLSLRRLTFDFSLSPKRSFLIFLQPQTGSLVCSHYLSLQRFIFVLSLSLSNGSFLSLSLQRFIYVFLSLSKRPSFLMFFFLSLSPKVLHF